MDDDLPRNIILSDTIIDRVTGIIIERDTEKHDRLWLHVPLQNPRYFDGADAIELWRFYDKSHWSEE